MPRVILSRSNSSAGIWCVNEINLKKSANRRDKNDYKFCFGCRVLFHAQLSLSPVKYDVRTKLNVGRSIDNDAKL